MSEFTLLCICYRLLAVHCFAMKNGFVYSSKCQNINSQNTNINRFSSMICYEHPSSIHRTERQIHICIHQVGKHKRLKQITVHDEELRLRKGSFDGCCSMCHIAFHLITSHKYILYCQAPSNRNHHCQFI